jgi:hypothetical protein
MASPISDSNVLRTVPASRVAVQAQPSNENTAEDTPFYKTYPFALGSSGLALGALGGFTYTSLRPDVYVGTGPDGEKKCLEVHYSKQGNKPLTDASYAHYIDSPNSKPRQFYPDTFTLKAGGNGYVTQIPLLETHSPDLTEIDYERVFLDDRGLIRGREFRVDSPVRAWCEAPIPAEEKEISALTGMTHFVQLQLNKPIALETEAPPVEAPLVLFHGGQDSKTAQLLLKDDKYLEVALNEKGKIHNSTIAALNGLPVIFKKPFADFETMMQDVPAYINQLKAGLQAQEKTFGQNIFVGMLLVGGLGYGLGWFLDWKKRHDRNKLVKETDVVKTPASGKVSV